MTSSPPRVSFSEVKPSSSRSSSIANKDDSSHSRANSVSRRASLPAARVSVSDKQPGSLLASAAGADASSSEAVFQKSASRRASVNTGMMTAPYQKSPKEAPRWRPYTFEAQQQGSSTRSIGAFSVDDPNKPFNQRVLEKSAGSLVLGLFVIAGAFIVGSVTRLIIGRDAGILGFYINQLFLIVIYCIDRRKDETGTPGDAKRMDNMNAFEILTLVCQVLPILYTWRAGTSTTYSGLVLLIILQVVFKALLMVGLGDIVDISL